MTVAFRPFAFQDKLHWLSLADRNMQNKKRCTDRIGPFAQSQVVHPVEQNCARDDDEGIRQNEIFCLQPTPYAERVDTDGRQEQQCRLQCNLFLAAPPCVEDTGDDQPGQKHRRARRRKKDEAVALENADDSLKQ